MSIQYSVSTLDDKAIGLLKIHGDLDFDDRKTFKKAMDELFETGHQRLVVDISRLTRMSSVYIGTLIDMGNQAVEDDRELIVMMVEQLASVCRQSGAERVLKIVIAKEPNG